MLLKRKTNFDVLKLWLKKIRRNKDKNFYKFFSQKFKISTFSLVLLNCF